MTDDDPFHAIRRNYRASSSASVKYLTTAEKLEAAFAQFPQARAWVKSVTPAWMLPDLMMKLLAETETKEGQIGR